MLRARFTAACLLAGAVLLSAGRASWGQEVSAVADPVVTELHSKIATFLEGVSMGQAQTAYQELLAGSQLLKKDAALKALVEKTNELEKRYGKYYNFERVAAKRVGNDLVLLKYLYKCENFPVVWYFTLYRTPTAGETPPGSGTWRVVAVRFDTELELLAF